VPKLTSIKDFVVFVGPILLVIIFLYFMIVETIYVSMTDWRSAQVSLNFVGLENYYRILGNPKILVCIKEQFNLDCNICSTNFFSRLGNCLFNDKYW